MSDQTRINPLSAPAITLAVCAVAASMCVEDRSILASVAERLRPPERLAPSAWAEKKIYLTAEQTARPGPFSADVYPHQRDAMDAHFNEPEKLGVITVKPAQIGWTLQELIDLAYCQAMDPGPELVVCCDELKAKEYCVERFEPIIKSSGQIARIVEEAGEGKKVVGYGVHFPGGKVSFAWATSEKRVVGTPFKRGRIDDAEASFDAYPSHAGDLFVSVETRTETYRGGGGRKITMNGHPRLEDGGLWHAYWHKSDRRCWTIDCPECAAAVGVRWKHVHYREMGPDGRPDPSTAEFRCPHCSVVISDAQRARALWPSRMGGGGSGRFESELDAVEARRRQYIGLHVTRLCDPRIGVVELARRLHECGDDQAKVLDVLNKVIGEPMTRQGAVTLDDAHLDGLVVRDQFEAAVKIVPEDVEFVTLGGDVQVGPTGEHGPPGLYLLMVAWARSGMAYICDARTLVGFDALLGQYLPRMHVKTTDGRHLPISWAALDAAWATSKTLEACRGTVYASCPGPMGGSRVQLAGVRYDPRAVDAARTIVEAPENKRRHPTRPELGFVEYWFAHRHSWVDRTHRRFAEKRVALLCPEPKGWREHLNANFLGPVKLQHDWQPARLEWTKAKQVRDDWARAFDYAEVIASVKLGLDGIHLRGEGGVGYMDFRFGGRAGGTEW